MHPTLLSSYGIKLTLSFQLLLNHYALWNKFLNYKPKTKCLPNDTFLAVVILNSESEVYKAFKGEEGCNSDTAKYLSTTKIILSYSNA